MRGLRAAVLGIAVGVAACGAPSASVRGAAVPTPFRAVRASSDETAPDGAHEVAAFEDARGVSHELELVYRSYPIVVTSVRLDGAHVPEADRKALGRGLVGAGVRSNLTILLGCFPDKPC